jgi:hypothetical protein
VSREQAIALGWIVPRDSGPTPQKWIDVPTLRLDPSAKIAAVAHVAEGPIRSLSR